MLAIVRRLTPLLCLSLLACNVRFASLPDPGQPRGPMPQAEYLTPERQEQQGERYYQSWWFWSSIGVAIIAGAAVAVAISTGGTDRVAAGADGRFNPRTFPTDR